MADAQRPAETPITLAFVGYAATEQAGAARAYEDRVLPLLADHGGEVRFRGHRAEGQPGALPVEVHVLWFPGPSALDAYLADPRRIAALADAGDVFTTKQVVEVVDLT